MVPVPPIWSTVKGFLVASPAVPRGSNTVSGSRLEAILNVTEVISTEAVVVLVMLKAPVVNVLELMPLAGSIAKRVGTTVNDRSMNLELFEEVEDSVLDLYSGTRNLYLQRRERAIGE